MAFDIDALITRGIAVAKQKVATVMVPVDHYMVIDRDQSGPILAEEPVIRDAIVEDESIEVIENDGTSSMTSSKLTFLEPVPVDDGDQFVLPDGRSGQVAKRGGLMRADGTRFYSEVWLGKRNVR